MSANCVESPYLLVATIYRISIKLEMYHCVAKLLDHENVNSVKFSVEYQESIQRNYIWKPDQQQFGYGVVVRICWRNSGIQWGLNNMLQFCFNSIIRKFIT